MSDLTHLDERGHARMVDVADKPVTRRVCVARGAVRMSPETVERITQGRIPKGDVLATARIAGIQAAKRTGDWIPLCHPLPLDAVEVQLEPGDGQVVIEATARAQARTGVEMEALVAVAAAGLTLYDMCKAVDREMVVDAIHLVSKTGGKSGTWQRNDDPLTRTAPLGDA